MLLALLLGVRSAMADGSGNTVDSKGVAVPPASVSSDGSDSKSPFTITASLREIYDDNVLTSKANTISSFDTDLSPSVLFDHPMENSDIFRPLHLPHDLLQRPPGQ